MFLQHILDQHALSYNLSKALSHETTFGYNDEHPYQQGSDEHLYDKEETSTHFFYDSECHGYRLDCMGDVHAQYSVKWYNKDGAASMVVMVTRIKRFLGIQQDIEVCCFKGMGRAQNIQGIYLRRTNGCGSARCQSQHMDQICEAMQW